MVTCPNCGARVKVVGGSDVVTCEYCNTSARVQRRSTMFRVMPPPNIGPAPIALQRASRRAILVFVAVIVFIPLVIIGAVVHAVISHLDDATTSALSNSSSSSSSSGKREYPPEWQGTDGALYVDVDGDAKIDIIGRSRRIQNGDVVRVIALVGSTGKVLWESEPIGTYSDSYQGKLSVIGDVVLYASPHAEVRAMALRTGATRWKTKLEERVEAFCTASDDTVVALTKDGVVRTLHRADGTAAGDPVQPTPAAHGRHHNAECSRLASDNDSQPTQSSELYDLGRKLGISSDRITTGPGGRVLSGTRERGTRVPTLIALDDQNQARWTIAVPKDPLGSLERAPEAVAVSDHQVCASYYLDSVASAQHMACFALDDGHRLWDGVVGGTSLRTFAILDGALAVSTVGRIELFDLATGKHRWQFGP
jgi:outer membrane protein assembly factor BamB